MKKANLILLIIFILLAVILNFLPHLNYSYPLHVDEWVHFQYSNHLSSDTPLYLGQEYNSLEAGFHYLLATLNSVGISYIFMFTFFASLITIFICLGVFILTRRLFNETAGVFAVLFIVLLKSTVMILGPVFFVPMAIGMFFITISLFLIKLNSKSLVLILASILIIHPPTAMAMLLLINIEFLIKKKDYLKNIKLQLLAGLIALPFYLNTFLSKGFGALSHLEFLAISGALFIPRFLGWTLVVIALIGIYFSVEKKKYSIAIYTIALLFFIFIFYQYKIEVFIPYRRALMYLFLILAVPFGFGCERIINIFKNKKFKAVVGIILIIFVLATVLPAKLEANKYIYHIINEEEHNDFIWIKENTDQDSLAVLHPWKADAFTPIAERQVYSRVEQGPNIDSERKNKEIDEFFKDKCQNMGFLKQNNIEIIYGECENTNLEKVHNNVWMMKD